MEWYWWVGIGLGVFWIISLTVFLISLGNYLLHYRYLDRDDRLEGREKEERNGSQ